MAFPVNLSPLGFIIRHSEPLGVAWVQLLALIPLAYMSLCTFYSLFKLRVTGRLVPRHTTPGALLFNAMYLIRLQFSLGYNYLVMLYGLDGKYGGIETGTIAFQRLMSNMETVPILGTEFIVYSPLLMALFIGLALLNVYARFLQLFGIDVEEAMTSTHPDAVERIMEGKKLLAMARQPSSFSGASDENDNNDRSERCQSSRSHPEKAQDKRVGKSSLSAKVDDYRLV